MAKFSKLIRVTKSSIAKGKPGNAECCAVARACKAAGLKGVSISDGIEFSFKGKDVYIKTSDKISTFIDAFDRTDYDGNYIGKKLVKPFEFTLRFEA